MEEKYIGRFEFSEDIELNENSNVIFVIGTDNSGKSSLINFICKKNIVELGDICDEENDSTKNNIVTLQDYSETHFIREYVFIELCGLQDAKNFKIYNKIRENNPSCRFKFIMVLRIGRMSSVDVISINKIITDLKLKNNEQIKKSFLICVTHRDTVDDGTVNKWHNSLLETDFGETILGNKEQYNEDPYIGVNPYIRDLLSEYPSHDNYMDIDNIVYTSFALKRDCTEKYYEHCMRDKDKVFSKIWDNLGNQTKYFKCKKKPSIAAFGSNSVVCSII